MLSANSVLIGKDEFKQYIPKLTEHYLALGKRSIVQRFSNYITPDAIKEWVKTIYDHDSFEHFWIFNIQEGAIVAVGHLLIFPDKVSEFFISVVDDYQNKGLGSQMTTDIINLAEEHRVSIIEVVCSYDNKCMLSILKKNNFELVQGNEEMCGFRVPVICGI